MIDPSGALLRAIVDGAAEAILVLDEDGHIRYHNPASAILFGYDRGELEGREIRELIPDDMGIAETEKFPELPPNLILAFAGLALEARVQHRDGTRFPADVTVSRLEAGLGCSYTIVARSRKRWLQAEQERQRLQTQLHQAHKLESVGQLAAGIAHEINTPTQYVGDNLQFLRDSFQGLLTFSKSCVGVLEAVEQQVGSETVSTAQNAAADADLDYLVEEVPRAIEQALEGIGQIATIVSAMKAFCHPGSRESAPVDLNAAIASTVNVCSNEWKYASEVVTELDPDLPPVHCNENEIKQVILNIVVNAAHALSDNPERGPGNMGTITLRTRVDGSWAEMVIADNGPGIPEDIVPKIFDPFFTTKEVGKGTGQGLAIAHTIVTDNHGGDLAVHSRPGAGTEFVIRLPLEGVTR